MTATTRHDTQTYRDIQAWWVMEMVDADDLETAHRFGTRIATATLRWRQG